MIDFQAAKIIALQKLKNIESEMAIKLTLLENVVIEFEYGWIFGYQSDEFIKTGDFNKMIGGNAPLLVDKQQGVVFITGTGKDISDYIKIYSEFKKAWLS